MLLLLSPSSLNDSENTGMLCSTFYRVTDEDPGKVEVSVYIAGDHG